MYKKNKILLGITACLLVCNSTSAMNPFSDVPSDHWAYDSINKLILTGALEGYGDSTFRGDRLMTRYEMAQLVAKAMAMGANVDKLAAEFADELSTLNVRVKKLEENQDNVKITGEVRAHFASLKGVATDTKIYNINRSEQIRSRINFNGKINDNWSYFARLENIQDLEDNVGEENVAFQQAHIKGRLGGLNITAGRFNLVRDTDGNIYDNRFDGINVSYGNKYKIGGYYGKPATFNMDKMIGEASCGEGWTKAYGVNASASLGKSFTLDAGYDKFSDNLNGFDDNGIFDIGLKYNVGKLSLGTSYFKSDSNSVLNKKGVTASVNYSNLDFKKPGSWDIGANYYKLGDGVNIVHTMNGNAELFTERFKDRTGGGFKGFRVGGHYTLAKNMVLGLEYYNLRGINNSNAIARTLWSEISVYF